MHLANDEQNIALLILAISLKTVAVRDSAVSNAEIHVSVFWEHSNVVTWLLLTRNVLQRGRSDGIDRGVGLWCW